MIYAGRPAVPAGKPGQRVAGRDGRRDGAGRAQFGVGAFRPGGGPIWVKAAAAAIRLPGRTEAVRGWLAVHWLGGPPGPPAHHDLAARPGRPAELVIVTEAAGSCRFLVSEVHRASTAKGRQMEVPVYSLAKRNRRRALARKLMAAEQVQALVAAARGPASADAASPASKFAQQRAL
jgi:hypothetical protein